MLLVFFDLGFLQTFRRVFDTDKLAFTELLGVPNAIRGVGFLRLARQLLAPREPMHIRFSIQEYPLDSILALLSGVYIHVESYFSFLYWKMEYHIEHHMFPMVPSYNLPKLHEVIKDQLPAPKKGLLDAYKEIIPAVIKKSNDPNYFIPVKVPS